MAFGLYCIVCILVCAGVILWHTLFFRHYHHLRNVLKELPQSGFWINCQHHGDVPLPQFAYDKQNYCCPLCGQIPRKIWKR